MLILKDTSSNAEGEWFDFEVRGTSIELKIRPLTADTLERIRKKYKKVKRERDSQTRQLVKIEEFDEDAINADLVDYVLEDFKGVGAPSGKALEVNAVNKKRVMELPPLQEEQTISEFVFDKAREVAATVEEEVKESIKK